uniref:SpoIIE family protein phosphatase n=1 Tax=Catenulispora pinisilvae TaxID=2705253 RepID=UPI00189105F3
PEPRPPLGLADLADGRDEVWETELAPDTTLLLMTDGVTEARDRDGTFYDPIARLTGSIPTTATTTTTSLVRRLRRDIKRHTAGRPRDDMMIVALNRGPEPTAHPDRRPRPRAQPMPKRWQ